MEEWHDMEVYNPTARHLQRLIGQALAGVAQFDSLLDVGCGAGINLKAIRAQFPRAKLFGTDLSPNIAHLARQFVGEDSNVAFDVLDIAKDRLPRQFDVVLCNQVLEHVEDDRAAVQNLAAMCERHMVITVPAGRYNSTSRIVGHYRHYSRDSLVRLVRHTDFRITSVRAWGFPIHSVYKAVLGALPASMQKRVGFGKYGTGKRLLSNAIYLAYFANQIDAGANLVLVAERP